MSRSYWQDLVAEKVISLFDIFGIELIEEFGFFDDEEHLRRVDLGSGDFKYGIEIKSGKADLKTGYGLNQESFAYGYVICPEKIVDTVIGYLYINDYHHTGVLAFTDEKKIICYKSASYNSLTPYGDKHKDDIADIYMNVGDIMWLAKVMRAK